MHSKTIPAAPAEYVSDYAYCEALRNDEGRKR